MAKIFRPSTREANILSKIESGVEREFQHTVNQIKDSCDTLSKNISMKLIEEGLIETTSKEDMEVQLTNCIESLVKAEDFDIDYQIAPFRQIVARPNKATLYITAYIVEKLITHKSIVDIFGTDEDIYLCVHKQIVKCTTPRPE